MNVLGNCGDLVCRAKQKRPVDAKNSRVVGNVFILQNVNTPVFDVVVGYLRHRCGCGNTADEQQCGQNHSRFNGDCKISKYSERKGNQPNADVSLGEPKQLWNLAPLAHVVSDNHQDARQCGHWDVAGQRRSKQQHT